MQLQLELSACVFVFPVARRTEKVREVARALCSFHGDAADRYWRQQIATLRKELRALGLSEATTRDQLIAFHHAVQDQLAVSHLSELTGGAA